MGEIVGMGVLLGVGAALSVGPIFLTILQEAAARGFTASSRIIVGSAVADLILLYLPLRFPGSSPRWRAPTCGSARSVRSSS